MNKLPAAIAISAALFACSPEDTDTPANTEAQDTAETPTEGVKAIVQLYETSDFDTLIRTRYAEISKAEGPEQIQSLVDKFSGRFEDDAKRNQAIATYNSLLELTPELSEDGQVATFKLGEAFVKLSRMPNGHWGFHL